MHSKAKLNYLHLMNFDILKDHSELSDRDFISSFESCVLPPTLFNHEAHLRLAWISIKRHGIDDAEVKVVQLIKNYVAHLGATDKYHHTLTVAAVKTVWHFYQKSRSNSFREFINQFPRLNNQFKGLIDAHYSKKIINSDLAKVEFLEPDILAYS